jgi:uncharacterized protein YciI
VWAASVRTRQASLLLDARSLPRRENARLGVVALFALTEVSGPNWDASRERREQDGWDEHAAFMDSLAEDGFVVLGGPIGDGRDVLLVVEAADEHQVKARLDDDPWFAMGILRIAEIRPWTIWLDGRRADR